MTAPDPRVGEIEARLAAATPGPWMTNGMDAGHSKYDMNLWVEAENGDVICDMDGLSRSGNEKASDDGSADSNFIANAPADIAYLLAELRDRGEKLARVEGWIDKFEASQSSDIARDQNMQFDLGYSAGRRSAGSILRAAVAAAGGGGG